ncbi:MAG: response regulator [Candidatus Omnitrophica bacterium]|nr:response regulator [Candidatus Omnitrophota bacterium]
MDKKKSTILVVDDEPQVVNILKDFLGIKGYDVSGALSGEEAIEMLKSKKADLILLDILMPGLKGPEVAKIVKKLYPDTKIVIITAFPKLLKEIDKDNILQGILIKPFKLQELYPKLQELLLQKASSDEIDNKEINAKTLYIKADILIITPSMETYTFLREQLELLSYRGQQYEFDIATKESEVLDRVDLFKPDIVIFEETYLNSMDYDLPDKIREYSPKTKKVFSFDLANAQNDYNKLQNLIAVLRQICIENGLVQVG